MGSERHKKAIKRLRRPVSVKSILKRRTSSTMDKTEIKKAEPDKNLQTNEASEGENHFKQWSLAGNGTYIPCFETAEAAPAGVYQIRASDRHGLYMKKQKIVLTDNLLELPITESQEIISDIEKFWEMRDGFRKYKMVYKRGILMHGPPGCGKSYLIQNIISKIVARDGICFTLQDSEDVGLYLDFIYMFRDVEPDRPIVVVIEDIDNVVQQSRSVLSGLLNVLDGVNQIDNVVYIATTNYPELLQERLANRPSRFDRKYEIKYPNAKVRAFFIKNKLHPEDLAKINLKEWVTKTKGLSLSHIKELVVSTMIFNKQLDEVLVHFENMNRPSSSMNQKGKGVGFNSEIEEDYYEEDEVKGEDPSIKFEDEGKDTFKEEN